MLLNPSRVVRPSKAGVVRRSFPALAVRRRLGESHDDMLLRQVIDSFASSIAILDESGSVLYANKTCDQARQHKNTDSDLVTFNHEHLCMLNSRVFAAVAGDLQRILDGDEKELQKEYSYPSSDGSKSFLIHAARLGVPSASGFRVLVTCEDVTKHRRSEAELRDLGGRLITGQEEERRHVARELHDDFNQRLAILSIELAQLEQKLPQTCDHLKESLKTLETQVQEISTDIHRLSYRLHPAKLNHLGLAAAIKSLCDEISARHKIEVEFKQNGFPATLSPGVSLCVYRIVQESLHNVIKHSGATTAQVVLRRTSNGINLCVSDSGCGFDMQSLQAKDGLGLISMKERLRLIGGTISIRSRSLTGTRIDVVVPV